MKSTIWNTENPIVLFENWRGDLRKEAYCQFNQQFFYFEELTQIEWSIKAMEVLKKQKKEDNEHLSDYCFEFDTSAKSRFFRILCNQLYKFKRPNNKAYMFW